MNGRSPIIPAAICSFALSLAGCVGASETAVQGPSGQKVHTAKCSASPNGCLTKAAATCKGPYQVLGSESHAGGLVADILPGPVTWYSMSYQCGPSDGKMPAFPFGGQTYSPPPIVFNSPQPVRPPVTCTSRTSGTIVGQPSKVTTTCY